MTDPFEMSARWIDTVAQSDAFKFSIVRRHENGMVWLTLERPDSARGQYQVGMNAAPGKAIFLFSFSVMAANFHTAFQVSSFLATDTSGLACGTVDGKSITLEIGASLRPEASPFGLLYLNMVIMDVCRDFEQAITRVTDALDDSSLSADWQPYMLNVAECKDFSEIRLTPLEDWVGGQ